MNKTIVNEDGTAIGYLNGNTVTTLQGYTYGCACFFGEVIGNVSFIGTSIGNMISGHLIPTKEYNVIRLVPTENLPRSIHLYWNN